MMKMIKEVIVVEGKADIARVKQAVQADLIATNGFSLRPQTLEEIKFAYERRGIIILTDPDGAGERIRRFLAKLFPEARHAFVPKEDAMTVDDVGIEQASSEAILAALNKARPQLFEPISEFSVTEIIECGLSGKRDASIKRARLGALLGIGYGNSKQFLRRLNSYGVTREEWKRAWQEMGNYDGS